MRGVSPSRRYGSGSRKGHPSILQDSTGSVTVTSENPDDIPLRELGMLSVNSRKWVRLEAM